MAAISHRAISMMAPTPKDAFRCFFASNTSIRRGDLDPFFCWREEVGELAISLVVQFPVPNTMISACFVLLGPSYARPTLRTGLKVFEARNS